MRTLAIDLGAKRVGLALSDEGGRFATPLDVLTVSSPHQALEQIVPVIEKEGVERVVVGLPLNMDDSLGRQAQSALAWGRQLADRSGKPVLFVDERLSSFAAEETLTQRKRAGERLTRERKRRQLDAVAAATFLQQFLDGKLQAMSEAKVMDQPTSRGRAR
ncbi:MAG TPA: Holliday junction resolvase RuvX [Tepidisphaeraceae bacterium]|jgi:putative Holliday junction resolvase